MTTGKYVIISGKIIKLKPDTKPELFWAIVRVMRKRGRI